MTVASCGNTVWEQRLNDIVGALSFENGSPMGAHITLSAPAFALPTLLSTSRRPVTDPMSMHSLENPDAKLNLIPNYGTLRMKYN